jgi:hypothetical protein
MNYIKLKIFFVIWLLLFINLYSRCENNNIHSFLKTFVKAYSDGLVDEDFMKNLSIKFPFFEYSLIHSELSTSDRKNQKKLTVDLIYAKDKGNILDAKLESIIIQFKEKKDFIKISELVQIFGKWVYRTKYTKESSISFVFKDVRKKEFVKIRCIGIFWKDLVQTLILTKAMNSLRQ